jgi:hypothetical protein
MASPIKVHRPKCAYAGQSFMHRYPNGAQCTCFQMRDGTYPRVLPTIDPLRGVLVVITEWRRWHNEGDYYVFAWTTAPDRAWDTGYASDEAGNTKDRKFWIANNATQVREYMRRNPREFAYSEEPVPLDPFRAIFNNPPGNPHWVFGSIQTTDLVTNTINGISDETLHRSTRKDGTMNAEALRRQALLLMEQADLLDARPKQPKGIRSGRKKRDPRVNVIWWRMRFKGGTRYYTYAAVQTPEGTWYTSGPRSPKDYSWDDLINWIYDTSEHEPEIFTAISWESITEPLDE